MREYKFRAWDDVAKKMFYSQTEQFDDMLGFRFQHFETDKPIYMQFTGLHDKNGKEIYEGDIVASEFLKWIIRFEQGCFVFAHSVNDIDWGYLYRGYKEFEVISNIHANPELLRGR